MRRVAAGVDVAIVPGDVGVGVDEAGASKILVSLLGGVSFSSFMPCANRIRVGGSGRARPRRLQSSWRAPRPVYYKQNGFCTLLSVPSTLFLLSLLQL